MAVDFEREVYCILGLPLDAVDMAGAVQRIRNAIAHRTPCFLSTPNLNWIVGCRADARFRESVVNSDLSVVDGTPLVWIARALGIPIPERVAGSGLFERLREDASTRLAVYFFGGESGVAEAACRKLNAESSGLTCAGSAYPGFGSVEEMSGDEVIAKINASGADFIVVSLGARKGQMWIERNQQRLVAPVISHLGAVVNFVAGAARQAPAIVQRSGFEWLWRIKEEPKLWRRYFWDGLEFLQLLATRIVPYVWFLYRHEPTGQELATAAVEVCDEDGQVVIRMRGSWARENLGILRKRLSEVSALERDIRMDLGRVSYVDSAFVGLLMLLHGHLLRRRRCLHIVHAPKAVLQVVKYCCAEYLCMTSPA